MMEKCSAYQRAAVFGIPSWRIWFGKLDFFFFSVNLGDCHGEPNETRIFKKKSRTNGNATRSMKSTAGDQTASC